MSAPGLLGREWGCQGIEGLSKLKIGFRLEWRFLESVRVIQRHKAWLIQTNAAEAAGGLGAAVHRAVPSRPVAHCPLPPVEYRMLRMTSTRTRWIDCPRPIALLLAFLAGLSASAMGISGGDGRPRSEVNRAALCCIVLDKSTTANGVRNKACPGCLWALFRYRTPLQSWATIKNTAW